MKKLSLALVAMSSLILAPVVFADSSTLNGYYSSQHPQATAASANAVLAPPTDITITNASTNLIYAIVPNSPINDVIYSGNNDHIRHGSYSGDTHIVLQDPNYRTFFDTNVCHYAVVTVYGAPGSYRVNVDKELC